MCAAARDNDSLTDMMEFAAEMGKVKVLPTNAVEVSSTEIREKAARGEDFSELVPEGVCEYIKEKNIYSEQ